MFSSIGSRKDPIDDIKSFILTFTSLRLYSILFSNNILQYRIELNRIDDFHVNKSMSSIRCFPLYFPRFLFNFTQFMQTQTAQQLVETHRTGTLFLFLFSMILYIIHLLLLFSLRIIYLVVHHLHELQKLCFSTNSTKSMNSRKDCFS